MLANVSFEMESTNYQLVTNADHNTNSKLGEDPPPTKHLCVMYYFANYVSGQAG